MLSETFSDSGSSGYVELRHGARVGLEADGSNFGSANLALQKQRLSADPDTDPWYAVTSTAAGGLAASLDSTGQVTADVAAGNRLRMNLDATPTAAVTGRIILLHRYVP